jgi:hypothetical protein
VKRSQIIWDALQNYGRIEWKWTLKDLEEAPNVAYQDILKEFDPNWGVKNLIVTKSNLVVTWMDKP